MNLEEAVRAHADWKLKFRIAISKKEKMDSVTISKDNCCLVGQWLYGEGKTRFGSKPELQSALDKHKVFHSEAGKVASMINAGKYAEAESEIGSNASKYSSASNEVGIALIVLKKAAGL